MSNIALYPGSFDPFTIGHLSVLEKAVKVFDKVYVVVSQNPKKERRYNVDRTAYALLSYLKSKHFYDDKVVLKVTLDYIPARIAKALNCSYIIRGLRNNMDYDYEEGLAKFNKEVDPEIETIYFRADNDNISSTMVHRLDTAGLPIDKYLPYEPKLIQPLTDDIKELLVRGSEVFNTLDSYGAFDWGKK